MTEHRPGEPRLSGWQVLLAHVRLGAAVVKESALHPTRNAKIRVMEGGKVETVPSESHAGMGPR